MAHKYVLDTQAVTTQACLESGKLTHSIAL